MSKNHPILGFEALANLGKAFSTLGRFWTRSYWIRSCALFGLWIFFVFFKIHSPSLPSLSQDVREFSQGWEFAWLSPDGSLPESLVWLPYTIGQEFPDRSGRGYLLLRNRLPDLPFSQPSLYFSGVDQSFKMYVEDTLVYEMGKYPIRERSDFGGFFRYILIPLQPDFANKTITLQIHSKWNNIGLSHTSLIGREADIIFHRIVTYDAPLLATALISFWLCLFFLFLSKSLNKPEFGSYSGLYLFLTFVLVYESHLTLIFFHHPVLITLIGQFGIPMTVLYLLEITRSIAPRKHKRTLKKLHQIYSIYLVYLVLMVAHLQMDQNFQIFVVIPTWTTILICNAVVPFLLLKGSPKLNRSQISYLLGMFSLILGNLPQVLFELNFLSVVPPFFFHLGIIGFILLIAFSAYDSVVNLYKLMEMSKKDLQGLVADRTRSLEQNQKKILELEREIVKKQTEESMLADFHDKIGAKVLDLRAMLSHLRSQGISPSSLLDQVDVIASGLKDKINSYEDKELMKKDFFTGLRASLFHRYDLHQRRVILDINAPEQADLNLSSQALDHLQAIFFEIVSNDIKYGDPKSRSNFWVGYRERERRISIVFTTKTNYQTIEKSTSGHGKNTLRKRIQELQGYMEEQIMDNTYNLSLHFLIP